MNDLFGGPLFDASSFSVLVTRLGIDAVFAFVVVAIYERLYRRLDYVFTYGLLNLITFSLCFILRRVPVELGFALGLFAVFGILRYRTEPIRLRDLTYLFVVIGLGIVNAVATEAVSLSELLFINTTIAGAALVLERRPGKERLAEQSITYDRLDLLHKEMEPELFADIQERTGLVVRRVVVEQLDLVREVASLQVFYRP